MQAQDGFEGALNTSVGSLVTGFGSIPAISGAHSLWLEADSPHTLHLRRAANETKLSFSARSFMAQAYPDYSGQSVRAGVVGGSHIVVASASAPAAEGNVATGDPNLAWASAVIRFEATLDEPGTDVILDISKTFCYHPPPSEPFPCPKIADWTIDDLKLE